MLQKKKLRACLSIAGSEEEAEGLDASQSSDQQDDSSLDDDDDDPLGGETFDMSGDDAADDQSIPSDDSDDDSPADSSPGGAATAQGRAKAPIQNGEQAFFKHYLHHMGVQHLCL